MHIYDDIHIWFIKTIEDKIFTKSKNIQNTIGPESKTWVGT